MSNKVLPPPPFLTTYNSYSIGNLLIGDALDTTTPVTTAWGTANLAIYIPFYSNTMWKFTTFSWRNGTTASGNIDCGLYTFDGVKLVSTGTVAQSGTSAIQNATVASTTIGVGVFFLAMALSSATGTIYCVSEINAGLAISHGIFNQGTAFNLPATATFADPTSLLVPLISIS